MAGTQTATVASGNAWDGFDGDMNAALDAEFGIQREAKGDTHPSANSPGAGTQQQTATTQPNAGPTDSPTHILTADGKHALPYDVLKRERERAQQAEASNRQLQAELERLRGAQAQPGGATSAATTGADAPPEALSAEELAELEEVDPLAAKAYRNAQYAMTEARQLRSQVTPVLQQQQQARLTEEQQVALAVQQDIEQTPALRWLQDRSGTGDAEAQALWDEAVQVDNTLKTLPAFAKLPQAERFAEVVKQMEAAHGAFQLPAEYLPVQTSTQQKAETPAEKAARLVEEARQRPAGHITRLSQMEGGARPESHQQRLAGMSAAEMFALSETLSEAEFDRLGWEAMNL